jgi:DMSO/TMAO reductase YedYZ molybdopterin-dependent catalytic subunit
LNGFPLKFWIQTRLNYKNSKLFKEIHLIKDNPGGGYWENKAIIGSIDCIGDEIKKGFLSKICRPIKHAITLR